MSAVGHNKVPVLRIKGTMTAVHKYSLAQVMLFSQFPAVLPPVSPSVGFVYSVVTSYGAAEMYAGAQGKIVPPQKASLVSYRRYELKNLISRFHPSSYNLSL